MIGKIRPIKQGRFHLKNFCFIWLFKIKVLNMCTLFFRRPSRSRKECVVRSWSWCVKRSIHHIMRSQTLLTGYGIYEGLYTMHGTGSRSRCPGTKGQGQGNKGTKKAKTCRDYFLRDHGTDIVIKPRSLLKFT